MAAPQDNNGGAAQVEAYEMELRNYERLQQDLKEQHTNLLQRANTVTSGFRSTSTQTLLTIGFSVAGPALNHRMGRGVGGPLFSWLFYLFFVSFFHSLVTSVMRLRWVARDLERLVNRNRRLRFHFSDFVDSLSDERRMNLEDRLDLFEEESDSVTDFSNGYYADLGFACLAFCAKIGLLLVVTQHI